MKKSRSNYIILIIVLALILVIALKFYMLYKAVPPRDQFNVLLLYNPVQAKSNPGIVEAYQAVFEEEGVPYKTITPSYLLSCSYEKVLKQNPVIIIPDVVAQTLPDLSLWFRNYLTHGGSLMVVYDSGTRNRKRAFLEKPIFAEFLGVNYQTYARWKGKAYTEGFIQFKDSASADFFQIPAGMRTADNIITGYKYGKTVFPLARIDTLSTALENDIYAYALTEDGGRYPALIIREQASGGHLLYANLPLGYLKIRNNDFPLRAILRTFLFKAVKIPHLVNTPSGKGGLVINWHVDSNNEWAGIPFMEKHRLFRKSIECSLHVTAGDFVDEPGDGMGFEAFGEGRPYLEILTKYGTIGSHGGWGHNWFAENLSNGKIGPKEEEEYIKKNNDCLQDVVGYKIIEYSAPVGVHPQPVTTNILEKLGFVAYYYTGDMGSAPNRTFVNGKMVSSKLIAFPVMPYRGLASLEELEKAGILPGEARKWWCDTLDYTVKNKTVRLIYSHPYDFYEYPEYAGAFDAFLNYAEKEQNEGKVRVKPMSYFAQFMLKFLKTQYVFNLQKDGLEVNLKNSEGLNEITLAIPKDRYRGPLNSELLLDQDNDYYYLTYTGNLREKTLHFANQ